MGLLNSGLSRCFFLFLIITIRAIFITIITVVIIITVVAVFLLLILFARTTLSSCTASWTSGGCFFRVNSIIVLLFPPLFVLKPGIISLDGWSRIRDGSLWQSPQGRVIGIFANELLDILLLLGGMRILIEPVRHKNGGPFGCLLAMVHLLTLQECFLNARGVRVINGLGMLIIKVSAHAKPQYSFVFPIVPDTHLRFGRMPFSFAEGLHNFFLGAGNRNSRKECRCLSIVL